MSILELVRKARAEGDFSLLGAGIPYMKALDMHVHETNGCLTVELRAGSLHIGNPWLPALHGGVIGGVLETVAIVQLAHDQDGDSLPKPINVTIDYLRSGRIETTWARAQVTKHGRRVANVQASCWQGDPNKPIATLVGHFLLG